MCVILEQKTTKFLEHWENILWDIEIFQDSFKRTVSFCLAFFPFSVFQTTEFLQVPIFFCHLTLHDNNAINYHSDCTPFVLRVLLGHIANCQVWELAGKCAWLSKDEKELFGFVRP